MRGRRTRVKICCIACQAEADRAIAAGADALGLVGAMPSGPGPISLTTARAIAEKTPPPVATFYLTASDSAPEIAREARASGAGVVQIVRPIAPGTYPALITLLPLVRRVQVIHVEDARALDRIAAYAPFVDAFLLDSGRPSAATAELGGTGRVHDWGISAAFVERVASMESVRTPVFLAGGLTPGNVAEAVRRVQPFAVDVCSGVRTGGVLDDAKLAAFMASVRAADDSLV